MAHAHDYPQWLNLGSVTSNGATYAQTETQLNPPTQQHVLEICKVQTRIPSLQSIAGGAGGAGADVDGSVQVQITRTTQAGIIPLEDPDMVHLDEPENKLVAMETTETGAGYAQSRAVNVTDYMCGDKGFLVAAQSLFLGTDTNGNIANTQVNQARILARYVKVDLTQLIEMVLQ